MIKNLPANAGVVGDGGWISWSGRSPGGGTKNPLQYSCQENLMERGIRWTTALGVAELDMNEATEHAHKCKAEETFSSFLARTQTIKRHRLFVMALLTPFSL